MHPSFLSFIHHCQVIVTLFQLWNTNWPIYILPPNPIFTHPLKIHMPILPTWVLYSSCMSETIWQRLWLSAIVGTSCPQKTPKVVWNHFEFASLCLKAVTWKFQKVVAQILLNFNSESMHLLWIQSAFWLGTRTLAISVENTDLEVYLRTSLSKACKK